jgi:HK97 family phage major capsid protein
MIKFVNETEEDLVLEGMGIVFNKYDLDGEVFTKNTNFFVDSINYVPVLYGHNAKEIKEVLGKATISSITEEGVLFDIIIKRSNKYFGLIKKLVELGRLGLSTGALPQTLEKDGNFIKQWQIGELSLVENPAEPSTIFTLKEIKYFSESSSESVETLEGLEEDKNINIEVIGENNKMETNSVENESVKASTNDYDAIFAKFEEKLSKIMNLVENTPVSRAGYVTQDGGTADKNIKSFGDFLLAVKRNDHKRLTELYKTTKDLGEAPGSSGGYLVPMEYGTNLIQVAAMENMVYSRVQKVPVLRNSGTYPALDQYFTPTAGSGETYGAGGVKANFTQAGHEFTETEPVFSTLEWRLNKVGGFTEVENELLEDSPFAIEALLRGLFQVAIAAKNERNILRGSGLGEPLGILNSNVAIGVSDETTGKFKWEDVGKMYSKFKSIGGQPTWIMHPSVFPQLMIMNNNTVTAWQSSLNGGPMNSLNGYPIIVSEHMPQLGANGAVMLADLSSYVMWEKAGLTIAFSDQVGFKRDVGTWVFRQRNDGKPWFKAPITLSGPGSAYTVSPFVYIIND